MHAKSTLIIPLALMAFIAVPIWTQEPYYAGNNGKGPAKDPRHRIAALANKCDSLRNQNACRELAKIAQHDKYRVLEVLAVRSVTDQAVLAKVALGAGYLEAREAAVQKLTDQPLLAKLALEEKDEGVREAAVKTMGEIKDPRAVEPLIAALKDLDSRVRIAAIRGLGAIKDTRAVEPLIAALKDLDFRVEAQAASALGAIKDPRAVDPLIATLTKGRDPRVQEAAGVALLVFGTLAAEPLVAALRDPYCGVRLRVAAALGRLGAPAVDSLTAALKDPDSGVRFLAAAVLGNIKGSDPNTVASGFESRGSESVLTLYPKTGDKNTPFALATFKGELQFNSQGIVGGVDALQRLQFSGAKDKWLTITSRLLVGGKALVTTSDGKSYLISNLSGSSFAGQIEPPPSSMPGSCFNAPAESPIATVAAQPATFPATILSAESIEALRSANAVRALQPQEDSKKIGSLPGGVYGFTAPWIIDTYSSWRGSGTSRSRKTVSESPQNGLVPRLNELGLSRSSLGTAVMEIHKYVAGELYVVGYLSGNDLARLQDTSRTSDAQATLVFSPFHESLAVAIPISLITASKHRLVSGEHANDLSVGVVSLPHPQIISPPPEPAR